MKQTATTIKNTIATVLTVLLSGLISPGVFAASPTAADDAINQYTSDYLIDAFEAVSKQVAYEPYAGSQRGAEGTALSTSGNSIDQALLLAKVLEGQITQWRLANGQLDGASVSHLLSESNPQYSGSTNIDSNRHELYDPVNDKEMRRLVRNHFWLEVKEDPDDEWKALDPSFPGANPGDEITKARRYFDEMPGGQQQKLTVKFMQRLASGKSKTLGKMSGSVAELSRFPVALIVRGIPQYEDSKDGSGGNKDSGTTSSDAGGLLGGGLFGGGGKKKANDKPSKQTTDDDETERKIVGTEYRRELTYAGKEPGALASTMVSNDDDSSTIAREWIEFSLSIPGERVRSFSRDLFVASDDSKQPAAVRRYSIAVVAGEMTRTAFDDYRGILDIKQVNNANATLEKLKQQTASNETAFEIMQLESSNSLSAYLINLAFAYESDALSNRLASRAGVRIVRDIPRVLITSVETDVASNGESTTSTTLDLRLDEVSTVPMSGWPAAAGELFQRSRGMQESALEGRVLARFVENSGNVVTTEKVMQEAQKQGHPLVVVTPDNRDSIKALNKLPVSVAARLNDTLDGGHQVIIPAAAAVIDGRNLWGWWDVNPATGAFVGVMQGGQHQAMTQYTVTLDKIGVNDAMGYVIGAMVGSTATMTLYAAKMIEYGAVTPQLIREVAAGIERLTCVTCPSFEVSVSPMSGSAGFSSQCFDNIGVGFDSAIGVSGSIDFCENYKLGISCAASLMLGTFEIEENVSIGPDATLDLGPLSCD